MTTFIWLDHLVIVLWVHDERSLTRPFFFFCCFLFCLFLVSVFHKLDWTRNILFRMNCAFFIYLLDEHSAVKGTDSLNDKCNLTMSQVGNIKSKRFKWSVFLFFCFKLPHNATRDHGWPGRDDTDPHEASFKALCAISKSVAWKAWRDSCLGAVCVKTNYFCQMSECALRKTNLLWILYKFICVLLKQST